MKLLKISKCSKSFILLCVCVFILGWSPMNKQPNPITNVNLLTFWLAFWQRHQQTHHSLTYSYTERHKRSCLFGRWSQYFVLCDLFEYIILIVFTFPEHFQQYYVLHTYKYKYKYNTSMMYEAGSKPWSWWLMVFFLVFCCCGCPVCFHFFCFVDACMCMSLLAVIAFPFVKSSKRMRSRYLIETLKSMSDWNKTFTIY